VNRAQVYRQIAWGDLLLFSSLALPVLGALILHGVMALNRALALPGGLEWSPTLMLFLQLLGLMGAAFATMRLVSPVTATTAVVTVAVKWIAAMFFGWSVWRGAPALLGVFGVVDLIQGGILLAVLKRVDQSEDG